MTVTTVLEANSELTLRLRQQELAAEFATFSLQHDEVQPVLDEACRVAAKGMECTLSKVLEFLPDDDEFVMRAGLGWRPGSVGHVRLGADMGSPAGYAFRTGQPVRSNHLASETRFRTPKLLVEHGVHRAFNVLLETPEWRYGVLEVDSPDERDFSISDTAFLQTLAATLVHAVAKRNRQQDLRDGDALKTAIMDAALDCLVVVDAETRIREFNPAAERIFSQAKAEVLGQELGALILPADFLVGHLKKFAHFLDDGEISAVNKHVEVEAERANGERFPAELSVTPLKVGGEALFAAYLRDITERKRAERDLEAARDAAEEANRAKSDFIANMSHELRTPLSAIIGYSEMMREEMEDGADSAELAPDMQKIENNARHLLGLINDVLDLSKIESGKMEVFLETFEVEPMVRDVASTVTSLVDRKGNLLSVDLGPDLGSMRTDLTKLKQMLLNLLSNAAKFTEGGTIKLSAHRSIMPGMDRLTFDVRDSGMGMTEEQRAKLFQRYTQAEASTASKFGGTGLGLSISLAFATMLGGRIDVASEAGHGSTFTIDLPAEAPDRAAV